MFRALGFMVAYASIGILVLLSLCGANTSFSADIGTTEGNLGTENRIFYQTQIEHLYWKFRKAYYQKDRHFRNFEKDVPQKVIFRKVDDYLQKSLLLKRLWNKEITGVDLQNEINRITSGTKYPGRLQQLWSVCGNDPHIIAECVARPLLVDRLIRQNFNSDRRFQGRRYDTARREWNITDETMFLNSTQPDVAIETWTVSETPRKTDVDTPITNHEKHFITPDIWQKVQSRILEEFSQGNETMNFWTDLESGMMSGLLENDFSYYGLYIIDCTPDTISLGRRVWKKELFDLWFEKQRESIVTDIVEPVYSYTLPSSQSRAGNDEWMGITSSGAPSARYMHAGIWTGAEMFIWGGYNGSSLFKTGGLYDPMTDSWSTTNSADAPTARRNFTAILDGSDIYIWGGYDGAATNTGSIYDVNTNSWTAMSTGTGTPPTNRYNHSALIEPLGRMYVFNGKNNSGVLNTVYAYYPNLDDWSDENVSNPPSARQLQSCNFLSSTGTNYFVIWGGQDGSNDPLGDGQRYQYAYFNWYSIATTNVPSGRFYHSSVTDSVENRMLVWGGYAEKSTSPFYEYTDTGGIYRMGYSNWQTITTTGAPTGRMRHSAVWTGKEMIVWGGDDEYSVYSTGGRYNPDTDTWVNTNNSSTDRPSARTKHTAVWTDVFMIVWGGDDLSSALGDGAIYYSCYDDPSGTYTITAEDNDVCSYDGISVSWSTDIEDWGDYDSDDRSYFVLRDGTLILSGGCGGYFPYNGSGGVEQCVDTTAVADTEYYYQIMYANSCGRYVVTSQTPAIADENVNATNPVVTVDCTVTDSCGYNGLTISWPQNPGGGWGDGGNFTDQRYYILQKRILSVGIWLTLDVLDYGDTSYLDSSAMDPCEYRVQYTNVCSLSDSTSASAVVIDVVGGTPSVSQVLATADTCSGVLISWPKEPDAWNDFGIEPRYYRVRRDGSAIGDNIEYDTAPSTVTYIDTGATPGTAHSYVIRYKNGCENYTDTAAVSGTDIAESQPSGVQSCTTEDIATCLASGIRLTWPHSPSDWGDNDVDISSRYYRVWRRTASTSQEAIGDPIFYTGSGDATYVDDTVIPNIMYYYAIRYINSCGLRNMSGDTSGIDVLDETPCASVDDTLTVAKVGTDAQLDWADMSGCSDLDTYRVYGAVTFDAAFPDDWTIIGTPTSNTLTDLLSSSYYCYKVITVDSCGNTSEN